MSLNISKLPTKIESLDVSLRNKGIKKLKIKYLKD